MELNDNLKVKIGRLEDKTQTLETALKKEKEKHKEIIDSLS